MLLLGRACTSLCLFCALSSSLLTQSQACDNVDYTDCYCQNNGFTLSDYWGLCGYKSCKRYKWVCCSSRADIYGKNGQIQSVGSYTPMFPSWLTLDQLQSTDTPCIQDASKLKSFEDYIIHHSTTSDLREKANRDSPWRFDRVDPCSAYPTSATKPARCTYIIAACGENSNWVCDSNPTEEGFDNNRDLGIRRCCSPASSKWLALYSPDSAANNVAQQVKTLCGYTDTESVHTHAPFKKDVDQALERPFCGAGVATSVPKRVECCTGGTLWTRDTTDIKDLCYKSVGKPQDRAVAWKCRDKTPTDTYWDPWLNANTHVLRKAHHTQTAEDCCGYVSPNKKNDDYSAGFSPDYSGAYSAGFKSTWESSESLESGKTTK